MSEIKEHISTLFDLIDKAERNVNVRSKLFDIINLTPIPIWAKQRIAPNEYVMWFVNQSYATTFLKTGDPHEYIGKTDYEVWPKEVADGFVKNDEDVFIGNTPVLVLEPYITTLGDKSIAYSYKYPLKNGIDLVCGMFLPYAEKLDSDTVERLGSNSVVDDEVKVVVGE